MDFVVEDERICQVYSSLDLTSVPTYVFRHDVGAGSYILCELWSP